MSEIKILLSTLFQKCMRAGAFQSVRPFQSGSRLIVHLPEDGGQPKKATVISLTETGKIRVSRHWPSGPSDPDGDHNVVEIDPNHVILELPLAVSALSPKQLLRGLWSNLIFGRVTRVVVRAQDVNIWYNRPSTDSHPDDSPDMGERLYLGDNREVLKRFTREEIRDHITLEYDFYFGFCGSMDRKQQTSRGVPFANRAPGRWVEEDGDLCIPENVSSIASDDQDYEKPKMSGWTNTTQVPGEDVFHFSSSNYCQPCIMNPTFDPVDSDEVMQNTNYSVIPPRLGSLICGIPVPSKRGVSLSKWWIAPEPFFELWKLLQSNRTYPSGYCTYNDMKRLKWHDRSDWTSNQESRFFQELAMFAIFESANLEKLSRKTQLFFSALNKLVE